MPKELTVVDAVYSTHSTWREMSDEVWVTQTEAKKY